MAPVTTCPGVILPVVKKRRVVVFIGVTLIAYLFAGNVL